MKEFALSEGLPALKTIVSVVKEVSDMFPPLKTAAAGLLAVLECIDVCIPSPPLEVMIYSYFLFTLQKVHGAKEELNDAAKMLRVVFDIVESHRSKSVEPYEKVSSLDNRIRQISV